MKAQELGAILGGFYKLVATNCFLLAQAYGSFYMVLFYLKNLFGPAKRKESEAKSADVSVNNYTGESAMERVTQSIVSVQLSFFAFYFRCCRRQSAERQEAVKAFKAAEEYIKERLDVKYLLEHFEKFDGLCQMVLTEEQKETLKLN